MSGIIEAFREIGVQLKPNGSAEQRVPCPRCGSTSAFSANIEDGRYHCFRCVTFKGRVGDRRSLDSSQPIRRRDDSLGQAKRRQKLRSLWNETVRLGHRDASAVRSYLEYRGLGEILHDPPVTVRAHHGLKYWNERFDMLGTFPAMVALVHGRNGDATTLHVTYLRSDGLAKANVPHPKKVMSVPVKGSTKGGALRLYEPRDGVLGIAEGIESALSLSVLHRIPVWAASCAGNMPHVFLPKNLRELHIGVDLDASGVGLNSAQLLADRVARWESRPSVIMRYPDMPVPADLNDELRRLQGAV